MKRTMNILKVFLLLALLTTISGCRGLSEMLDPGEDTANLRELKREKPNLSSESVEAAEIDVDPDSDALTEDTLPKTNSTPIKEPEPEKEIVPETESVSTTDENPNESDVEQREESSSANVVTHNSFGKIKVGMTVAQASQALGIELVAPNGKGECYYVEPKQGLKGVDFMVIEGLIARIDIESKEYATDKGARIGDTEAKIKSLYKGVEVHPQKYDEKLHDMEVYSDDKKYLIIFETDGKVVTGFRIGRAEEVSWVERCG